MTDILKPIQPYLTLAGNLAVLFYVVFVLALAFWIWRDARRRGAMSWFWAVAVLPFSFATWAIYMIVRPPDTLDDAHERDLEIAARESELSRYGTCPNCFKPVEPDFLICPTCMKKLKKQCSTCGRPIKLSWQVCPYCKAKQSPADMPVEAAPEKRPRQRSVRADETVEQA
jgi:hypothetical protein